MVAAVVMVSCGEVPCEGVSIASAAEWKRWADRGCTHVYGALAVTAPDLVDIDAPVLREVDGGVTISGNAALETASFGALASTTSLDLQNDPSLTRFAAPMLTALGGPVNVLGDDALTTLSLPRLQTLDGELRLDVHALTALELPALTSATSLLLQDNVALTTLSLPALTAVQVIAVHDNPALREVHLARLASATSVGLYANSALTSVDLAALSTTRELTLGGPLTSLLAGQLRSADRLNIRGTSLERLGLPALTAASQSLDISGNAVLPQCEVDAVVRRLTTPPAAGVRATGNLGSATCP